MTRKHLGGILIAAPIPVLIAATLTGLGNGYILVWLALVAFFAAGLSLIVVRHDQPERSQITLHLTFPPGMPAETVRAAVREARADLEKEA